MPAVRRAHGRPPTARTRVRGSAVAHPSLAAMLWRGLLRRCPWCAGSGAFFTGWFRKQETCRTCGIGWRRGLEGFELGAATISVIIVFGTLVSGIAVGVATTTPDIPVVELVVALGAVAVVLPVVIYPVSYTIWQAIDLAMNPPGADDAPPAPPPRVGRGATRA